MSKLQNIATVWSDSDSETASKTPDELYQTFLDAKNFFEPELKFIEDPVPPQIEKKPEPESILLNKKTERSDDEQIEIGPVPLKIEYDKNQERKMYQGMNINPTEAHLYAQYIQQGKRIPRRGEVGITSQEIEYFESIGYVMSGSRHKKINAVRQRIEGKVYSAEDKRALVIFNLEENIKKEKNIINGFKYMMQNTSKSNK